MNSICRDIFKAIHEGKWLKIEYKNQSAEITRYWIGIRDLDRPDFGDRVDIRPGEVPVFWPCGVTPQAAVMASKPAFAITHAPGHMLVTDVKNIDLKY